mmetsp:Transcript_14989/g.34018  ORF Transcript_14989/g.34018 Transcript_14989/m.34018 type:complete len:119 (+) Transcript_14989:444-800(+)
MPGIVETTVGYTGGAAVDPTYESVCGGDGHTEAIRVEYDPAQVSYEDLLNQFWKGHSPTPSKVQYKSAIWYHDEEQKSIAKQSVQATGTTWVDVDEAQKWWDAEEYHQKYYNKGCGVQ